MTKYVEEEFVEEPVEVVTTEFVREGEFARPARQHESLAELAAEGPMDWPDDGSPARHQGYIDNQDETGHRLNHHAPVDEEGDPSLSLAAELAQRSHGLGQV